MRSFVGWQPGVARLGLVVVRGAVAGLQIGERRQHEGRTEASRQPGHDAGPAGGPRREPPALGLDPLSPEFAMRLLDGGEPAEYFGELGIGLAFGQRGIDGRTVDFALEIGTIARQVVGFGHGRRALVIGGRRQSSLGIYIKAYLRLKFKYFVLE
jgi:hypothetical protein